MAADPELTNDLNPVIKVKHFDAADERVSLATQTTIAAVLVAIDLIKNTDGIKRITDALPVGDNIIGRAKITDGTDVLDIAGEAVATSGLKGILPLGKDSEGNSVFHLAEADGTQVVAAKPPVAPPGTTPFVFAVDEAELEVGSGGDVASPHTSIGTIIGSGVNLFLQSVEVGTEGDPAEAGAKIEVFWREGGGPTDHLIKRYYIAGDTKAFIEPNINESRDTTQMTGNGTNTRLIVVRTRLSNAGQEVDFDIRGFAD
jgi:hypothetical protein